MFTMETAEKEHAPNNNNTFTHCEDQISGPSSNLASTTVTPGPTTVSGASTSAILVITDFGQFVRFITRRLSHM